MDQLAHLFQDLLKIDNSSEWDRFTLVWMSNSKYSDDASALCPGNHVCRLHIEEYTDHNAFAWCDDHASEFLVCMNTQEYKDLRAGTWQEGERRGCTLRITYDQARNFLALKGITSVETEYTDDLDPEEECFFLTPIIFITGVEPYIYVPEYDEKEDEAEEDPTDPTRCRALVRRIDPPVTLMRDCGFPYDHGGVYMAYTAYCPLCKIEWASTISGD
jgi:hypothetical protein